MQTVPDLITISLPTYRRPTQLLQALHSCFAQDWRPIEIDVGDSSPGDDTQSLVESLVPPEGVSLRYKRFPSSTEPPDKLGGLIAEARGQYFVLMHDDDCFLPGALSAMHAALTAAPDVVLAYGREQIINEAGELLPDHSRQSNEDAKRTADQTGLRRDVMVCALCRQVPPNGFLIETEIMRRIGFRSRAEIGLAEDTDFGIRLAQAYAGKGAFAFIDHFTTQRRYSPSSLGWTAPDTCWQLYDSLTALTGLSEAEEEARSRTLRQLARAAVRENALGSRRHAALQIFLSPHYPRGEGLMRTAYTLGLLAMPKAARLARRFSGMS